jgi:ferredoxin
LHSSAGNAQVAVTAIGFTTMFFIIVALAAALYLGYGRRSGRSRPAPARTARAGRPGREEESASQDRGLRRGFTGGGKFGVSHRADRIGVEVNPGKCARFGFCEHEAPEVFYLESDGRFGYQASVPVSRMEEVIAAMDVCPRRAIKLKLPPEHAQARVRPPNPPDEDDAPRRTVIPLITPHRSFRGDR